MATSEALGAIGLSILLGLVLFLDQVSALRLAVLRGLNHPVLGQLPEMIIRPLLIVLVLAAFCGGGHLLTLDHALWALGTASLVSAMVGGFLLRRRRPAEWRSSPAFFATTKWIGIAIVLAGNSGLAVLNSYVDILILGAIGSMEDVGVYRIASQVALMSGFAYTALNMLAAPQFAYLWARADIKALQQSAQFMARIAFLGALPMPLIFFFFGSPILATVFGAEFVQANGPMFPLFLGQLVNAGVGMTGALLIMSGRERQLIRFTFLSTVVNAVLSIALIPAWGVFGAALANMVATVVLNLSTWILVLRAGVDTSVIGIHRPASESGP